MEFFVRGQRRFISTVYLCCVMKLDPSRGTVQSVDTRWGGSLCQAGLSSPAIHLQEQLSGCWPAGGSLPASFEKLISFGTSSHARAYFGHNCHNVLSISYANLQETFYRHILRVYIQNVYLYTRNSCQILNRFLYRGSQQDCIHKRYFMEDIY